MVNFQKLYNVEVFFIKIEKKSGNVCFVGFHKWLQVFCGRQGLLPTSESKPSSRIASVVKDFKYADSHEWVKDDGNCATVGITDHARNHLGDVHVELSEVGAAVKQPRLWSSRKCQGNQ
ncbi:hypothetical protein ACFX15_010570 [Malus domestica]